MRSDRVSLAGASTGRADSWASARHRPELAPARAAAASRPHASRSRSSARLSGLTAAASKAPGETIPARARRSILRRLPKPARTNLNSESGSTVAGSTAGAGRRRIDTSAESTFGRGTNTVGGTYPTTDASAQ